MSSEAAIVAREIQDLSTAVDGVSTAIREQQTTVNVQVPEQQAPVVNVNVPEQQAPTVNVSVPEQQTMVNVNVPEQPAPTVNVSVPKTAPSSYEVTITGRSEEGFITSFVIKPM